MLPRNVAQRVSRRVPRRVLLRLTVLIKEAAGGVLTATQAPTGPAFPAFVGGGKVVTLRRSIVPRFDLLEDRTVPSSFTVTSPVAAHSIPAVGWAPCPSSVEMLGRLQGPESSRTLGCIMSLENRRTFLRNAAIALGSWALTSRAPAASSSERRKAQDAKESGDWPDGVGLPQGWRRMRKFDAHNHVMQEVHKPEADWTAVESHRCDVCSATGSASTDRN